MSYNISMISPSELRIKTGFLNCTWLRPVRLLPPPSHVVVYITYISIEYRVYLTLYLQSCIVVYPAQYCGVRFLQDSKTLFDQCVFFILLLAFDDWRLQVYAIYSRQFAEGARQVASVSRICPRTATTWDIFFFFNPVSDGIA